MAKQQDPAGQITAARILCPAVLRTWGVKLGKLPEALIPMFRSFLTICGTCMLAGGLAMAQQNPMQPQIRTGVSGAQQQPGANPASRPPNNGLPPARGVRALISPAPNSQPAGAPAKSTVSQPVSPAPKKDPRVAGTPAASAPPRPEPMGPPAPPSVIPQPARPADMPPVPPQVTYRNGLLTVNAVNSTMSSLLAAIRSRTGIEFEGAENSPERVAVSLGPAPEGEVLAAIFSGSGFDYVVLGRADSPDTVQRVVLTPKNKAGAGAGPVIAGRPPQPQQPQAQPEGEEEVPDETANVEQEPQDTAAQPPQVNPPPAPENQPQIGAPKTPEQLLQELKQMQQRQQDQQGGEQPPAGGPPPNGNQVPRKAPPQ